MIRTRIRRVAVSGTEVRQPRQCEGRHPRHHPRWPVVLVLLVSFATGVSFVVSISCFLGNAGRGTSSQAHDCAIVGIAGVDVCSPPLFLHHQHGVIQTLQADCTHCCLGRHEHHRLQSWAGENESIRVCPPPSALGGPRSTTFHAASF